MKYLLCNIFFGILLVFQIYCLEINDYQLETVGTINIGNGNNELGRDVIEMPGIAPILPGPLSISDNENIFIFDEYNQKFNVYDLTLNYLYNIDTSYERTKIEINYIYDIKFDENENLYIIVAGVSGKELLRINKNDNSIIKIDINNKNKDVYSRFNFFPLKGEIFYSENNETKSIAFNDNKGVTKEISQYYFDDSITKNILLSADDSLIKLHNFLQNNKIILYSNRLLTTNRNHWIKYYNFIMGNIKDKKIIDTIKIDKTRSMQRFLGFDQNDNTYWKGPTDAGIAITVFNKYGEIIDCFKLIKGGVPAVAPNGDIYYMETGDEKVTVFKITHRW